MPAGLPIIATPVGRIGEYGDDGINMLEPDEPSAEAAAAQVMRLITNEALRRTLGTEARARMLGEYSPDALRRRAAVVLQRE